MYKFILLFLFTFVKITFAANTIMKNLTIESNSMEVKKESAVLSGNVKIVSDTLNFTADILEIAGNQSLHSWQNIQKITAYMKNGDIYGTLKTKQSSYNMKCKRIEATSTVITILNAELSDGRNELFGEKITYDIQSQQLTIVGNEQNKVRLLIKNIHGL